jgi:hypothetical protein
MFKIGDKVTFTNDNGCVFPGKTIVGTYKNADMFGGELRYYYLPSDSPWFPVASRNLTLEMESTNAR